MPGGGGAGAAPGVGGSPYPDCDHLVRPKMDLQISASEVIEPDFEVLPLFEKSASDARTKKHTSLQRNEFIKCRWQAYKDHFSQRVFQPFEFPDINDYHFYIYHNRLMPSLSLNKRKDNRMKQRPGPGVDFRGQIPIPNELHLIKSVSKADGKKPRQKDSKDSKTKVAKN